MDNGTDNILKGPVFVVGMNGSGTTMLADSLGRHSGIYMLPLESKVLPYFIQRAKKFGNLSVMENRRRLSSEIGKSKAFWQVNGCQNVIVPDRLLCGFGAAGVIDGVYKYFAEENGKNRWGDKSPINTVHIHKLAELFPAAQFVHIIRDGRDAAQSFHRRWGYEPLHTITRWKNTVLAGHRQGAALGNERYIEVKYELLTSAPDREMRRICDFLRLEFETEVLRSSMKYMDPGNMKAGSGGIVANSEKWKTYFTNRQLREMEGIAGRVLIEFGYNAEYAGDKDPGVFRKKYWMLKDGVSSARSFFRQHGVKAMPMYFRHIRDAAKQLIAGMQ